MEIPTVLSIVGLVITNGLVCTGLYVRMKVDIARLETQMTGDGRLAEQIKRANDRSDEKLEIAINTMFERLRALETSMAQLAIEVKVLSERVSKLPRR